MNLYWIVTHPQYPWWSSLISGVLFAFCVPSELCLLGKNWLGTNVVFLFLFVGGGALQLPVARRRCLKPQNIPFKFVSPLKFPPLLHVKCKFLCMLNKWPSWAKSFSWKVCVELPLSQTIPNSPLIACAIVSLGIVVSLPEQPCLIFTQCIWKAHFFLI